MTMEDIPQGAFVCELVGQYMNMSSLSIDRKARQTIYSACADGDDKTQLNTFLDNHVVPLSIWATGPQGRPPVTSILDISESAGEAGAHPEIVLIDIPDSEDAVISLNGDSDIVSVSDTAASLPVSSSSSAEVGPSLIESAESESTVERLADSWKGQICIDCNNFGNIARFIRHRNKDRKMKKTIAGSVQSQSDPLLIRRLVYNNAGDRRFPKLALFAAIKIPANTELLI
jgi:SET domain